MMLERLDCLQSAFSLKNPSCSVLSLPALLQTTTLCYNKGFGLFGPDDKRRSLIFFSGLRPRLLWLACLGFACSNLKKKNKRLFSMIFLAVYALRTANVWKKRRLFHKRRRHLTTIDEWCSSIVSLTFIQPWTRCRKTGRCFSVYFLWSYATEAFLYFSQFCDLFQLRAEIA